MKSGSNLEKILNSGKFAVTAELGPPKSANKEFVIKRAQILKNYVDATNLTDNQTAIVRMSSIAAARIILDEDVEPVIQITCRDRNRIAIQSDVLGAAALGVKNILCITGDHQCFGNHPDSKNVFDIDSIQLVGILKMMRDEQKVLGGDAIKTPPQIFIGAAANPFADPLEFRVIRLEKKIKAGADFIQTQCIFDMNRFSEWMQMVEDKGLNRKTHILAGVTPIKSYNMAKHMAENVSGVSVPQEILKRMENAKDPKEEGVNICIETIEELRKIKGIHGVHIMAVQWEDIIPEIVKKIGLYPRPRTIDDSKRNCGLEGKK